MKSRQNNILTEEPKKQGGFFNRSTVEEMTIPFSDPNPVQTNVTTGNSQGLSIQKKCAACEQEEEVQNNDLAIQRIGEMGTAGNSPPVAPAAPASVSNQTTVPGTPVAPRFITEDSAITADGQMRKSDFLFRLKAEVCLSVNDALAGSPFTSDNCPYLQSIFSTQQNNSSAGLEALIARYTPESRNAETAEQVIQLIKIKAFLKAREWLLNGGTAETATQMVNTIVGGLGGAASAVGEGLNTMSSRIGNLLFKENSGGATASQTPQAVMNSLGKGQSIEGGTRNKMERAFGSSFSDVEIHTDGHSAQLSRQMNARAFTVGKHIAFANNEYSPGDIIGDALLAHELAHTIQQKNGTETNSQAKSSVYNALENDADEASVGAILSLWSVNQLSNKNISHTDKPRLKSGLKLQRCPAAGAGALAIALETAEVGVGAAIVTEGTAVLVVEGAVVAEGITVAAPATILVAEGVTIAPAVAAAPAVVAVPASAVISAPVAAGAVITAATISSDSPSPSPNPEEDTNRRLCQVYPLGYHRGGDPIHNNCADMVPPNYYPGSDIEVSHQNLGRKSFDAVDPQNRLWEIKTENYQSYSQFLKNITIANAMADIALELPLAVACGYQYVFGVRDQEMYNDLLTQVPPGVSLQLINC